MTAIIASEAANFLPLTPSYQTAEEPDNVEVSLNMPQWQYTALAWAANRQGLTPAELMQHILSDVCSGWRSRAKSA